MAFRDLVFALSGTLSAPRAEVTARIEAGGGTVAKSVTAAVTHVLTPPGAKLSAKVAKASARGVPIVHEDFLDQCEADGGPSAGAAAAEAADEPAARPAKRARTTAPPTTTKKAGKKKKADKRKTRFYGGLGAEAEADFLGSFDGTSYLQLKQLQLCHCDAAGVDAFAAAVEEGGFPALTSFSLLSPAVTEADGAPVARLAGALGAHCPALDEVELPNSPLGDAGLEAFVAGAEAAGLALRSARFSNAGVTAAAAGAAARLAARTVELDLGDNAALGDVEWPAAGGPLASLDVVGCGLTDAGAGAVAAFVQAAPAVRHLRLSTNPGIGNEGLAALRDAFLAHGKWAGQRKPILFLRDCGASAEALAEAEEAVKKVAEIVHFSQAS